MRHKKPCYFDYNATTEIAPEVLEAMMPCFTDFWGNPSSAYRFGSQLSKPIDAARGRIAELINADPREVIFTSCGSESNNTAIHSALALNPGKRHVLTTAVEHSAVMTQGKFLRKQGFEVTLLPVESDGSIDLHLLEKSIRQETAIVSIMWANNETGVILPIEEIAAICQSKGVAFHTDAVQAVGKLKIDVQSLGADFLSLSAHKLHAPKGIGALYVNRRTPFQPYLLGGGQERGRRGGTENVPFILGFGRAAELALSRLRQEETRVRKLRDRIEQTILETIPNTSRNGSKEERLPNTSNIAFGSIEAEAILMELDHVGICASSGSACTTGSLEPSHVLLAMGLTREAARSSVRLSLGYYTTEEDVNHLLEHLPKIITRLRSKSPSSSA